MGRDPSTDLAVLKVDSGDVGDAPALPLGDSEEMEVGHPVVAIGNPYGFTRTVTTGIVSAVQREIRAPNGFSISDVIQTDASINPGNSGGPLLDAQGRVIGINSQIATGGGSGSVGIGFAVPVNTAKSLLPELRKGGEIERGYLGITMAAVSEDLAEELDLPRSDGALITCVVDGGPADDAGLRGADEEITALEVPRGGDLLVEVDGRRIRTTQDVSAAIADDQPGETIEVAYYRGDDRRTAEVKLANRPEDSGAGNCDAPSTEP
jgi:S1-C subfamily serine protease